MNVMKVHILLGTLLNVTLGSFEIPIRIVSVGPFFLRSAYCVKIKFESTDKLPLNVLVNICSLILVVRYQRVYLNTCWYDQFYNRIQIKDTVR